MREIIFNPLLCFAAPLSLALVCVAPAWFARSRTMLAWLRITSLGLVLLGVLAAAFWSWYFRDGLGPGFIPSTGWRALANFWEGFAIPLAIGTAEGLAILKLFRGRAATLRTSASDSAVAR